MTEAVQNAASGARFYSLAKNNPEVLQKRQQRKDHLDEQVSRILKTNPGRRPHWDEERLLKLDAFALQHGKRCIMWDDQGAGFFLLINWDWKNNVPATINNINEGEHSYSPGWWHTVKKLLSPPLIDPTVLDQDMAEWLDTHTMKVHSFDVDKVVVAVQKGGKGERRGYWIQEDSGQDESEYAKKLQALRMR